MRCEECVDERGFTETGLTHEENVELKPTTEKTFLDLAWDGIESYVGGEWGFGFDGRWRKEPFL